MHTEGMNGMLMKRVLATITEYSRTLQHVHTEYSIDYKTGNAAKDRYCTF